jgi:hypothetical protein
MVLKELLVIGGGVGIVKEQAAARTDSLVAWIDMECY